MIIKLLLLISIFAISFALPFPKEEPIYSRHCNHIRNRRGRIVGIECFERFKTHRMPPPIGLNTHNDLNKFLAMNLINNNNNHGGGGREEFEEATIVNRDTITTEKSRPTISPNPVENENPDYTYLWPTPSTPFGKPSVTSTPSTTTTSEKPSLTSTTTQSSWFGWLSPPTTSTTTTTTTTEVPSTTTTEKEPEPLQPSTTTEKIVEEDEDYYSHEDEEEKAVNEDDEEGEEEEEEEEATEANDYVYQ